jgi:hypothetical protein
LWGMRWVRSEVVWPAKVGMFGTAVAFWEIHSILQEVGTAHGSCCAQWCSLEIGWIPPKDRQARERQHIITRAELQ